MTSNCSFWPLVTWNDLGGQNNLAYIYFGRHMSIHAKNRVPVFFWLMRDCVKDRQTDRQTQSSYIKYRLGSTYHNSAVVVHKIWLTCRKKKNLISIDMITLHKYTQIKCQFFHFNELQNITKTGLYGHNFRTNKDRRYFYFYFYCFFFLFWSSHS